MSFDLNKLVQPECGAPNPLVAAAQQIVQTKPGPSRMRIHQNLKQTPLNFTAEFLTQQNVQYLTQNSQTSSINQIIRPILQDKLGSNIDQCLQQQQFQISNMMTKNLSIAPQTSISRLTAADQLESKYRDDMIASTRHVENYQEETVRQKEDDVAFWQALSQKMMGPSTATSEWASSIMNGDEIVPEQIKKSVQLSESDYEYTFDERNPLKNQFEDPFTEGLRKLEQGDIPSAALLFEAAVELDPTNSVAWRYLGTTQAQNERDKLAIRALRNCLRLNEKDQEARLAIAVSLANESLRLQACEHLIQWLINHERYQTLGASLEEFYKSNRKTLAENNIYSMNYDYVCNKFFEAARMSPNNPDPDVQCSLGVLFNMQGEYDKAIDCFKAALSVRENDSLLWNRLGATLANGNRSDEALVAYRKALEIAPGCLRIRYNLAISLIHLSTYNEAAKQLIQILNMQAAGKGSRDKPFTSVRLLTSGAVWSTLRTVVTLMNKPEWYPMVDQRNLEECHRVIYNTLSD